MSENAAFDTMFTLRISPLQILGRLVHAVVTISQWMSPLEHTNVLSWALKRYNRYSTYVCFSPQGSDIHHHRALLTAFSSKGRKRNCGKLFKACFLSIRMVFID
jgi:hypothetical protein